jgi:peptidoglycan/xylan/chitin deacetylase (PgdA/CDA1 family)
VISFDDGYVDNLTAAKPLLQKFGAPATVYIATGYCNGRLFWWEELVQLLLFPGVLPESVCLKLGGTTRQWNIGAAAQYSFRDLYRHRRWSLLEENDPTPRHKIYRELCELLTALPDSSREDVMAQLRAMHQPEPDQPPSRTRSLTPAEVTELGANALVSIAAHTVHHNKLSLTTSDLLLTEPAQSKRWLEELLGKSVNDFAYPHGGYSAETVKSVRAAGFRSAVTCDERVIDRRADPFALPRFTVRDWNGDQFEQKLRVWLGQV